MTTTEPINDFCCGEKRSTAFCPYCGRQIRDSGPRETLLKYLLYEYKKLERRREAVRKQSQGSSGKKFNHSANKLLDENRKGAQLQDWIAFIKSIRDDQCPT